MELTMVYNTKIDKVYNAPMDVIDNVGMISVWEEDDFFVVLPKKLVPGRGEVPDPMRNVQLLRKDEGWQGLYVTDKGTS